MSVNTMSELDVGLRILTRGTPMDRSDAVTVRWQPPRQPARKLVFEPRSDGDWLRIEKSWTGCTWREVGTEVVDDVAVEFRVRSGETVTGP